MVSVLDALSKKHEITISTTTSDHAKLTAGGSISNHYYGRAVDIATVDGQPVNPGNQAARQLALELSSLDPSIRPSEIGSPWALGGAAYFTDGAHQDHLHVAFDAAIPAGWSPPEGDAVSSPAAVALPAVPDDAVNQDDAADADAATDSDEEDSDERTPTTRTQTDEDEDEPDEDSAGHDAGTRPTSPDPTRTRVGAATTAARSRGPTRTTAPMATRSPAPTRIPAPTTTPAMLPPPARCRTTDSRFLPPAVTIRVTTLSRRRSPGGWRARLRSAACRPSCR